MNTVTHTCPPLEDIAAFLDGKLSEAERARVVAHLADCEACYAVFAGAARFQLAEDDELVQEPMEAAAASERVVVALRRRAVMRWALPLAALLLLTLTTIPLYLQYSRMPVMASQELVSPAILKKVPPHSFWSEDKRSGELPIGPNDPAEFLIGAHLVDLRLALARNDPESANVITRINRQMPNLVVRPPQADFYEKAVVQIDPSQGEGVPPRSLLEKALRVEDSLTEFLEPATYLVFGKWTEAGRLSAIAEQPDFFEARRNRLFALWLLRHANDEALDPEVVDDLRAVHRLLGRDDLQERHYQESKARFAAILQHYQNKSEENSPF